ncbi:MAG: primosomal protein N' [Pseudomonadota bacterium]
MEVKTDLFGAPIVDANDEAARAKQLDVEYTRVAISPAAPIEGPLDYLTAPAAAPEESLRPGDYVVTPLGGREILGVVWGPGAADPPLTASGKPVRLKTVSRRLDLPPMSEADRRFLERAAAYTMTPLGEMTRLATRAPKLDEPAPTRVALRRGDALDPPATAPRRKALAQFEAGAAGRSDFILAPKTLAERAGVGSAVIKALVSGGHLREVAAPKDPSYGRFDPDPARRGERPLSDAQAAAAARASDLVASRRFGVALVHGVTGSGKTEAYLEAVAECLRHGRQALVLLPEIALTEAFLGRFEERFGARPAEWHSAASGVERRRCWRAAAAGTAPVVVGARSALYLPFRDLGLIVVDEEHDGGYKQEDGAIYHARDMAVLRAQCSDATALLCSATPSLESWANTEAGRYERVSLPARFGLAVEPDIRAVDLRVDKPERGQWLSPPLIEAVTETLARGEQALLFLNRRGYAPLTLCRSCGARFGCPHCDAWLVSHRFTGKLQCHLCGYTESEPKSCRECGSDDLAACGPGVERLAEEAAARFPDAKLALLSSDLAPNTAELKERIKAIEAGEPQIVIGTQIVAKGHNFPKLTLVGVVDADLGLQGGDFRASERTFQLLRQVAGRAGRADRPGRALLQTVAPEQPVMERLIDGDERGFLAYLAAERQAAGAPPYGRYLAVIFSGPDEGKVWEIANLFTREAQPMREIGAELLGPAPAPIPRIRGKARVRLLVKAAKTAPIQAAAKAWSARVKKRGGVRVVFDVDPQSFL